VQLTFCNPACPHAPEEGATRTAVEELEYVIAYDDSEAHKRHSYLACKHRARLCDCNAHSEQEPQTSGSKYVGLLFLYPSLHSLSRSKERWRQCGVSYSKGDRCTIVGSRNSCAINDEGVWCIYKYKLNCQEGLVRKCYNEAHSECC
jgi:hypothetical protein